MKVHIIVCWLLLTTIFFDFVYIPGFNKILKWFGLLFFFIVYLLSLKQKETYNKLVNLFNTIVLLSCINSTFFHGQKFHMVLYTSYFLLGFVFYSFLYLKKANIIKCMNALSLFSVIFCLCYIVQWILYPTNIFMGSLDEFSIGDSYFRMRMSCSICSYYMIFRGVYLVLNKRKITGTTITILGFIPAIIMGFRSLILLTIFFVFIQIMEFNKKNIKRLVLSFILFVLAINIAFQFPLVQEKIDDMLVRQERNETLTNSDYIRYISLDYYYKNTHSVISDPVVGSGVPFLDGKNRYTSIFDYGYSLNLYWNDLGVLGLALLIGFPAAILLCYILLRPTLFCKTHELLPIKYTVLTVLLGSIFTSQELFRSGNFVVLGIMLYILTQFVNYENRNINIS